MEQIPISKFKATCLAVLERVRRTRKPVLITKRGMPVAEVAPVAAAEAGAWLGAMAGTVEVVGDIVTAPAEPAGTWEAFKE